MTHLKGFGSSNVSPSLVNLFSSCFGIVICYLLFLPAEPYQFFTLGWVMEAKCEAE